MPNQVNTVGLTVWDHCNDAMRVMSQAKEVTRRSICACPTRGKLALLVGPEIAARDGVLQFWAELS